MGTLLIFKARCRCWYIAVVFLLYSVYGGRETLEIGGSESRWEFVGILASRLRSTETLVLAGNAGTFLWRSSCTLFMYHEP